MYEKLGCAKSEGSRGTFNVIVLKRNSGSPVASACFLHAAAASRISPSVRGSRGSIIDVLYIMNFRDISLEKDYRFGQVSKHGA